MSFNPNDYIRSGVSAALMPLPATSMMVTGGLGYMEEQQAQANTRARAEGPLRYRDIQQTENGYKVTERTGFLPENVPMKMPWVSANEYADGLISQYNARNAVPLNSEQVSQFRKEIEGGSRGLDALRNAVRNVSDTRQEAFTQASFNAAQERTQMYERMMAESMAQGRRGVSNMISAAMNTRFG